MYVTQKAPRVIEKFTPLYIYIYTKPPECVDTICRISRGFHSWCPGSTSL